MTFRATWAAQAARDLLADPLPRRWAHSQGVAARARSLAPILGEDAQLVECAAWLHDIGYAPAIAVTGFHPLDGARHLRDVHHADALLCRLVAHHSAALFEAAERGLDAQLAAEFVPPPEHLAQALIYCDLMTSPDGEQVPVEDRIADIYARYEPDHPVIRALRRSEPELLDATATITRRLRYVDAGQ